MDGFRILQIEKQPLLLKTEVESMKNGDVVALLCEIPSVKERG